MEYFRVARSGQVPDDIVRRFFVNDIELAVARWEGKIYITSNYCTHLDCLLSSAAENFCVVARRGRPPPRIRNPIGSDRQRRRRARQKSRGRCQARHAHCSRRWHRYGTPIRLRRCRAQLVFRLLQVIRQAGQSKLKGLRLLGRFVGDLEPFDGCLVGFNHLGFELMKTQEVFQPAPVTAG